MRKGIELIKELALAFGPTSCEGEVASIIREELRDSTAILESDRMGNLVAHFVGKENYPRVMLSAHMDEVGFMITHIEEKGYLRFDTLGGIEPAVLSGRFVTLGNEKMRVPGVIAAKGIHQQDAKERKKLPDTEKLYIDVGTTSRFDTEGFLSVGDFGVFDTPFATFGKEREYIKCKALDDRMGCAALIEILRAVEGLDLPLDLWFCFTTREEIGKSGALVTANRVKPDFAIILETTAIADIADVEPSHRVAEVGNGGVLSLLDRSTIYDRALVDFALDTGKRHAIPVQVKRYVSGGNDAAHVQRSGVGVRCMATSTILMATKSEVSTSVIIREKSTGKSCAMQ